MAAHEFDQHGIKVKPEFDLGTMMKRKDKVVADNTGGIAFLFHQLGSFMGGWLGGYLYDLTGSYSLVWQISILLSLMAALLNWPVREVPVARLQTGGASA